MRKSKRTKWRAGMQLSLVQRRETGHRGGTRPGAGRPRKPGAVSHDARERLTATIPQHVTLRVVDGEPSIARDHRMTIIRAAIRAAHKPHFRIVQFNVLGNHLHLITEARTNDALARGVQGLEVRLAKRLNAVLKRTGKLFAQRYHARYLRSPRQVRNALRYVLNNRRHHHAEKKFAKNWIDPCSSGAWFDGWVEQIRYPTRAISELLATPPPVEAASTWLLRVGWRRHGSIAFDEAPAL